MILGITGGSGGGKTTLLKELEKRGGYIIDCDRLYYEMLAQEENPLRRAIAEHFGDVFLPVGGLDRKKLAARVFSRPEELAKLNELVFCHLPREVEQRIANLGAEALVGIDAINLLESGLDKLCDRTIAITAPVELRVRRIMLRDQISEQYARLRISAQKSDEYYRSKCDDELNNAVDTPAEFEEMAEIFFRKMIETVREEKRRSTAK